MMAEHEPPAGPGYWTRGRSWRAGPPAGHPARCPLRTLADSPIGRGSSSQDRRGPYLLESLAVDMQIRHCVVKEDLRTFESANRTEVVTFKVSFPVRAMQFTWAPAITVRAVFLSFRLPVGSMWVMNRTVFGASSPDITHVHEFISALPVRLTSPVPRSPDEHSGARGPSGTICL